MMDQGAKPGLPEEIAAAFAWWRDAGVDCVFHDEAADWIAAPDIPHPAQAAQPVAEVEERTAPPAVATIDRGKWPQDLEAFVPWWMTEPSLDFGRVSDRVPPRGAAHAEVMVVVPQPEKEDRETLLSGPQGRLLDAMLSAMGIAPGQSYVASVLPRHTPHADWNALQAQGLGEVLAQHIRLARPRRLVALGGGILPLLGNGSPNSAEFSREFNHEGGSVPLLADRDLGDMLRRPRWKSRFWQRWLDWSS